LYQSRSETMGIEDFVSVT